MPTQLHRLFAPALFALSLAACSGQKAADPPGAGAARRRQGRGGRAGSRPVHDPRRIQAGAGDDPCRRHRRGRLQRSDSRPGRPASSAPSTSRKGRRSPKASRSSRSTRARSRRRCSRREAVLARDTATAKNATAQQARYEDLYKRGLIPRDQYETQSASATSLQATLAADQAAVETAKLNLQYTRITAPISGRTGDARRPRRGPRPRQRHDRDGRDQSVGADLRHVFGPGPISRRTSASTRRSSRSRLRPAGRSPLPPGAQPPAPPSTAPDETRSVGATASSTRGDRQGQLHRQRRRSRRPARSS